MIDIEVKRKYIALIQPLAQVITYQLGVTVDKICLHAVHESNWGQSGLTKMGHNHFGVTPGEYWEKAMREEAPMDDVHPWTVLETGHAIVSLPTTEFVKSFPPEKVRFFCFPGDITDKRPDGKGGSILTVNRAFRKYASDMECFKDYGGRLTSARYGKALEAGRTGSIENFANALGDAGYATDPIYAESLLKLFPSVSEAMTEEKTV